MLRQQKNKGRKEVGHKRRKVQSGIMQCCCECQSNQCCSNLGAMREKLRRGSATKITICMLPILTHAHSWVFVCPNLQYKRETCTTYKGNKGISIKIITKARKGRPDRESVVSATLKTRPELFVFSLYSNIYFFSSFNCSDVFLDQYIYVYFSHSKCKLNLLVVE